MRHLRNIFNLGIKELRSLLGDKAMLTSDCLLVYGVGVFVSDRYARIVEPRADRHCRYGSIAVIEPDR